MGRQRYSWSRTAFPFDSTSIVPVHDARNRRRRTRATGQERNRSVTCASIVACIPNSVYTHGWPYGYTTPAPNTLTATGAALIHRRTED